jgi:hypothetical protein
MVRISGQKPRLLRGVGRWNEELPSPVFYVNDFGWVGLEKWKEIDYFQTPNEPGWMSLVIPRECLEEMMKRKMSLPYGKPTTVWEFDAVARDFKGRIRFVAFFETERPCLVRWTWWDANVKYWVLRAIAWARTKVGR